MPPPHKPRSGFPQMGVPRLPRFQDSPTIPPSTGGLIGLLGAEGYTDWGWHMPLEPAATKYWQHRISIFFHTSLPPPAFPLSSLLFSKADEMPSESQTCMAEEATSRCHHGASPCHCKRLFLSSLTSETAAYCALPLSQSRTTPPKLQVIPSPNSPFYRPGKGMGWRKT